MDWEIESLTRAPSMAMVAVDGGVGAGRRAEARWLRCALARLGRVPFIWHGGEVRAGRRWYPRHQWRQGH